MAPVQRRLQRLLARHTSAASGQQREPVAQAIDDFRRLQVPSLGCRQLDGEGNAVETPADLLHRYDVGEVAAARRSGAVDEQRRCVGVGERRDAEDGFAVDAQWLTARREDAQRGPRRKELVDQLGARLDEVLTVIDKDERRARRQMRGDRPE